MSYKEQAEHALTHAREIVDAFGTIDSAGALRFAEVLALLALTEAVGEVGAEVYRLRIATEVVAGEALDRELCRTRHPAGTDYDPMAGEGALVVVDPEP